MNLEELRKSMESDATIENKKLKNEIEKLKKQLNKERKEHKHEKDALLDDCRVLANRCFALTRGTTCLFCQLRGYRCPRELSLDERVAETNKLMKECMSDD